MDFKSATDDLFARVTHDDLAAALGVSIPAIRQARIDHNSMAYRNPPDGWEGAVRSLAEKQMRHYGRLLSQLEKSSGKKK
jgi:hypothetical protein